MEIGSDTTALQQTGAMNRLDQIAKNLDGLTKRAPKTEAETSGSAQSWVDPKQRIPSIHQILPGLLKQLAEISGEGDQFASVLSDGSNSLPKKPTELSPLSFLDKEERGELQELLGALLNKNSDKGDKSTPQATPSNASNSSADQWALFGALKQVDSIISRGEDRLHENVSAQLSPSQEVLGHFLGDSEQNEAIALLGQKSLLAAKAEGNPLSESEQKQLGAIDTQVTAIFGTAENTLQANGINVQTLKTALTSAAEPNISEIIGQKNPRNTMQKDLVSLLQDNTAPEPESLNAKDNYALNSLSQQQQTVVAMLPAAQFGQIQQKFQQLGALSAKPSLTSDEAKKAIDLTKQTTELIQGYENNFKAQGVDLAKVTTLIGGEKSIKTQELEQALGIQDSSKATVAQEKNVEQIVKSFFSSESTAAAGETSLATAGVAAAKRKVEYPVALAPLEAIQKRIESTKRELLAATTVKESAQMREKMIAPVRNLQQGFRDSGAQPAAQPVEAQRSASELSASGFGSVISGRSR